MRMGEFEWPLNLSNITMMSLIGRIKSPTLVFPSNFPFLLLIKIPSTYFSLDGFGVFAGRRKIFPVARGQKDFEKKNEEESWTIAIAKLISCSFSEIIN